MAHSPAADRSNASESKFYLPAGVTPSSESSWVARLWATLFNHQVRPAGTAPDE